MTQVQTTAVMNSSNEHLTAEQASTFTNIPLATIYAYTSRKKIPHKKIGKRLIFSKQELTEWIVSFKTETEKDIGEEVEIFLKNKQTKYIK